MAKMQSRNDREDWDDQAIDASDERPAERDRYGRFTKSGNPKGRPRKARPPKPVSFGAAVATALIEPIMIKKKGVKQKVPTSVVLAQKLVNDALTGNIADRLRVLRALNAMRAFDLAEHVRDHLDQFDAINNPPLWTDELEADYQVVKEMYAEVIDDHPKPK